MDEPKSQPQPPAPAESPDCRAWMERHRRDVTAARDAWRARENAWSFARLVTFLAAASIWYPLRSVPPLAIAAPIILLALFGWAVRIHGRARARRQFGERLVTMTDEALRRCGGAVTLVRVNDRPVDPAVDAAAAPPILDSGLTARLTDQERDDLDLYAAPVGLFGLLNRTSSIAGARRLRDWLEHPCLRAGIIARRQTCARWIKEHAPQRVQIMAGAAGLRGLDGSLDKFLQAVRETRPLPSRGLRMVLQLWTIPSTVLSAALIWQLAIGKFGSGSLLVVLLGMNGLLLMQLRRGLKDAISPWRKLRPVLNALAEAAGHAAEDLPDQTDLAILRERLAAVADRHVLPTLASRIAWTDTGGFMHAVCNYVFFYDLHVAQAVVGCVLEHRERLVHSVGALADLEALVSLACFAAEQPVSTWPVESESHQLRVEEGAHPLIDPTEAVANSIALHPHERTWIITGSNMAGKSTFLRMAGVNVLLAQIGSAACAKAMRLVPHRLITDLRIRDDLAKHESYFLAEVRQLRRMVVPPKDGIPLFGLIDEPFRGTNSRDRLAAGRAVLGKLIASAHFFLVATHEERFTELGNGNGVANQHFHEDLNESGPVFDYRLHPGPATRRNALRILEIEGYPDDVVAQAKAWSDES